MLIEIDDEEHATILAALRLWQNEEALNAVSPSKQADLLDIAGNGGEFQPLDIGGIDNLCERINTGPSDGVETIRNALGLAESFMAGFEDDEMQEGITESMAEIREAIEIAGGRNIPETPPIPEAAALKTWTVEIRCAIYQSAQIEVEAATLEEACAEAIKERAEEPSWSNDDDTGPIYVTAIFEGDREHLNLALPIPAEFTERGE